MSESHPLYAFSISHPQLSQSFSARLILLASPNHLKGSDDSILTRLADLSSTSPHSLYTSFQEYARSPHRIHENDSEIGSVEGGEKSLERVILENLKMAYFNRVASILSKPSKDEKDEEHKNEEWKNLKRDLWNDGLQGLIPERMKGGVYHRIEKIFNSNFHPSQSQSQSQSNNSDEQVDEWNLENGIQQVKDVLEVLKKLCAPIRDEEIQEIYKNLENLSNPSIFTSSSSTPTSSKFDPTTTHEPASPSQSLTRQTPTQIDPITRFVITIFPPLFKLIEHMHLDMESYLISKTSKFMSERDFKNSLIVTAKELEVECILTMFSSRKVVEERSLGWLKDFKGLKEKTLKVLSRDRAVSVIFEKEDFKSDSNLQQGGGGGEEEEDSNFLPPIYFSQAPLLFALQNSLQVLIIVACLKALFPTLNSQTLHRLIVLLEQETLDSVAKIVGLSTTTTTIENEGGEIRTKLEHLVEEIFSSSIPLIEEEGEVMRMKRKREIFDKVERVLKYQDPVFKLLKSRLIESLKVFEISKQSRLALHQQRRSRDVGERDEEEEEEEDRKERLKKIHLHSGRKIQGVLSSTTDKNEISESSKNKFDRDQDVKVSIEIPKGFEDEIFKQRIESWARDFEKVIEWAWDVWGSKKK